MRKTTTAVLAAASLLALAGCKQATSAGNGAAGNTAAPASAATIDGMWKADIDSVKFGRKPDEFLLQGDNIRASLASLHTP